MTDFPRFSAVGAAEPFPVPLPIPGDPPLPPVSAETDPSFARAIELFEIACDTTQRGAVEAAWKVALQALADAFDGTGAQFVSLNVRADIWLANLFVADITMGSLAVLTYEKVTVEDPGLALVVGYPGRVFSPDLHWDRHWYNNVRKNFVNPPQIGRHIVAYFPDDPYWETLVIFRGVDDPAFTQADCARFAACIPRVRTAMLRFRERVLRAEDEVGATTMVQGMRGPVGLHRATGERLAASQAYLDAPPALIDTSDDWLVALRTAVRAGEASLDVPQGSRTSSPVASMSFRPLARVGLPDKATAVYAQALVLVEPVNTVAADTGLTLRLALTHMRETWGLTASEANVLGLLAEGLSPEAVAGRLNRSVGTIRTQIKSIRQRTGQTRLNAVLAMLERMREAQEDQEGNGPRERPEQTGSG